MSMVVEKSTSRCFIFRKHCRHCCPEQDFQLLELMVYLVRLYKAYWQNLENLKKYIGLELFHSVEAQCFSAASTSVASLWDKRSLVVLTPHNIKSIIIGISDPFNVFLFGVSKNLKLSFESMPLSVHVEIFSPF